MTTVLKDYDFIDLYLSKKYADLKSINGLEDLRKKADFSLIKELDLLFGKCCYIYNAGRDPEFSFAHDDVMYRATLVRDSNGNDIFVLRRTTAELKRMESLGIFPSFTRELVSPSLRGLVVIAGETGAGKTSTAVSILVSRLEKLGGIAFTVEDPPEVDLTKHEGKGRVIQIRASRRTGGYKEHLLRSLRANPDHLFLGEVRDEATAAEVVEASINGHLIISTIHAGSIVEAVDRLSSLASMGRDTESAQRKLASGLKMVIWQRLEPNRNGDGFALRWEALSLTGDQNNGARSKIEAGRTRGLVQDIEMQMNKAKNNPMG